MLSRFKIFKPCPNGGVRCGRSSACYPQGTICFDDRQKNNIDGKIISNESSVPNSVTVKKTSYDSVLKKAKKIKAKNGAGYLLNPETKEIIPQKYNEGFILKKREDIKYRNLPQNKYSKNNIPTDSNKNKADYLAIHGHKAARDWAKDALKDKRSLILEIETTGLPEGIKTENLKHKKINKTNVPELVALNMVSPKTMEQKTITLDPNAIGKSDFKTIYPQLRDMLKGKRLISNNPSLNIKIIDSLCEKNNLPKIPFRNRKEEKQNALIRDKSVQHNYSMYLGKNANLTILGVTPAGKKKQKIKLPEIPGGANEAWRTYDAMRHMASGWKPRELGLFGGHNWKKMNKSVR